MNRELCCRNPPFGAAKFTTVDPTSFIRHILMAAWTYMLVFCAIAIFTMQRIFNVVRTKSMCWPIGYRYKLLWISEEAFHIGNGMKDTACSKQVMS